MKIKKELRVAIDVDSITPVLGMFPNTTMSDIMDVMEQTGILYYCGYDEAGNKVNPPTIIDEKITGIDILTDEDAKEKLRKYLDEKR